MFGAAMQEEVRHLTVPTVDQIEELCQNNLLVICEAWLPIARSALFLDH